MVVVGRQAEQRWGLAAALEQGAGAALAPDLAASRLSHPATEPPDVVLLVVDSEQDVGWLHAHTSRSIRRWVPVVALVASTRLARAARAAGAAAVVSLDAEPGALADELRTTLAEVTEPAVVVRLDTVRTA